MTIALNIILMAAVLLAVVGGLAWAILSSRPAREIRPARSPARRSAHRLRAPGTPSVRPGQVSL